MRHDVVRQGAVPRFSAALGVHGILGVAELVQQVEGFDAGDELALEEGLADAAVLRHVHARQPLQSVLQRHVAFTLADAWTASTIYNIMFRSRSIYFTSFSVAC